MSRKNIGVGKGNRTAERGKPPRRRFLLSYEAARKLRAIAQEKQEDEAVILERLVLDAS